LRSSGGRYTRATEEANAVVSMLYLSCRLCDWKLVGIDKSRIAQGEVPECRSKLVTWSRSVYPKQIELRIVRVR
jgi:hypothetical protein